MNDTPDDAIARRVPALHDELINARFELMTDRDRSAARLHIPQDPGNALVGLVVVGVCAGFALYALYQLAQGVPSLPQSPGLPPVDDPARRQAVWIVGIAQFITSTIAAVILHRVFFRHDVVIFRADSAVVERQWAGTRRRIAVPSNAAWHLTEDAPDPQATCRVKLQAGGQTWTVYAGERPTAQALVDYLRQTAS